MGKQNRKHTRADRLKEVRNEPTHVALVQLTLSEGIFSSLLFFVSLHFGSTNCETIQSY